MKKSFIRHFAKEKARRKSGLTIAISGLAGSGKTSVGRTLAKTFDLKLVTPGDLFRAMAKERGMDFNVFLKTVTPKTDREIDLKLLHHAMRGNVIIDSRLAAWVAGDFADYKIFITAPLEERARRVAGRERLSYKRALTKVADRDEGDTARYKKIYGVDLTNLSIYDLVFNNLFFDRRTTSSLIKRILKKALGGRRE